MSKIDKKANEYAIKAKKPSFLMQNNCAYCVAMVVKI